jgi:glycosyltransferase involved in cell wall biosynthesis
VTKIHAFAVAEDPPVPSLADVTVVVPTRNEAQNVSRFLDSLPGELALVVVDDSTDATPAIVRRERPRRTRLIRRSGGLTEARQLGARYARTPWLLFTDADVAFDAGYFARLAELPACDVAYGPKLSRDEYRRYYEWFSRGQGLLHALGLPAASGSNLLVSARAFLAVDGFDLALACNEDSELVWRMHGNGARCVYDPDLIVWATDHRRLRRGVITKTAHTIARCALLRSGLMPRRWRSHAWGYWSESRSGQKKAGRASAPG